MYDARVEGSGFRRLGILYPTAATDSNTRARIPSLTFGWLLMTRDTVPMPTPA
jgi:hypothetical protein